MFRRSLTGVSREVDGCFKGLFWEFSRKLLVHEILEGVTRKIEEHFEGASNEFQDYFKEL